MTVPTALEVHLQRACTFLELGHEAEAESSLEAARLLADGSETIDRYLEAPCRRLFQYFKEGDHDTVGRLLRLGTVPGSYLHRVMGMGDAPDLSDTAIRERLERAVRAFQGAGQMTPLLAQMPAKAAPLRGQTILMVVREALYVTSHDSRRNELVDYLVGSAREVGLRPTWFPADAFLAPVHKPGAEPAAKGTPRHQFDRLGELLTLIARERPQYVLFEDLCIDPGWGALNPRAYRDLLASAKKYGFKLIAFYGDPFTDAAEKAADYVRNIADVVWLVNSANQKLPRASRRVFRAPCPYPDALFSPYNSHETKDKGATFVGSVQIYNYPRAIWLELMRRRDSPCRVLAHNQSMTGAAAGATVDEYCRFLGRVRMTVNFSARGLTRFLTTGRAGEAIMARSLLLEEDNPHTSRLLAPFVHYVPFRSIVELEAYIRWFERHDDERTRMADRARAWFVEHFGSQAIWRAVLAVADVRSGASARPRRGGGPPAV